MNHRPLGNVAESSLAELWQGTARRTVMDRLGRGDFSAGCQQCEKEIDADGRAGSLPDTFDELLGEFVARDWLGSDHPVRMEFNLSNVCNLRCVQCNGELSSAIRASEGRPPIPRVYGDAFFEQLCEFVPHLRTAGFAGGEPFLERLNFRIFDLIAELNPSLLCSANTNGTVWTPPSSTAPCAELDLNPIFSIDGTTAETFEAIRVGSSFEEVMTNLARYREIVTARGGWIGINYCLMRQNHHEFADLLLMAEDLDARVWVSVVRSPEEHSILSLPSDEILRILERLEAQQDRVAAGATRDLAVWNTELDRLRTWASVEP